ncbi:uncharacterized protein LOC111286244 isoform X5 [Durio zibethinus]|uniref:Uncharacterized protein LOC111286244 isoform X5 n=1 Tax=Durio zibethinus TaxID=66656 RepID=A0A6P5XVJ2_DURZI|nr:uncharacterized protein LOC111286244 isoform X5 [Durio zibethinus]
MQRCLLSSSTITSAALRLHPLMPKFMAVEIFSLIPSQLKFKKLRPPSRLMPSSPKLCQHLNLFTTLHNASTFALPPNHLTCALPPNRNIISTCSSCNGIRSTYLLPLSKRFFSQSPQPATKTPTRIATGKAKPSDSMSVRDGRSSGFRFRWFNRHSKKPKAVAALNGNKCAPFESPASTSLLNNAKPDSTSNSLVNNAKPNSASTSLITNAKTESKDSLEKKKQSRSKKKKEQMSSTVVPKEEPVVKGTKTLSLVVTSNISKNGQHPTQAAEKNSTGNLPTEAHDGSASTKKQSKKKSRSSSRKRQPMKEVNEPAQKQVPQHISQQEKPLKQLYPPTGKSVMVVESVTKAKVIQGYLGDMFEVLPSYGHVRDLAARSGSVRPGDDFSMVWEVPSAAWTHLKSVKVALSGAENLILASDPDREGEAISWHIIEMLQQQDALGENVHVARVVFHEITEASIKGALQVPREIDVNLLAQKLYEGIQLLDGEATGLITYTRTDGLHISDEAVKDIRSLVLERYGPNFTPQSARKYFKKVKNAMEAHEAIRPTDIRRLPSMLVGALDEDSLKLYTLIWSRTMACQMEPATIEQIQIETGNCDESISFRSSCSRVAFLGYQSAYQDAESETIRFKDSEANDCAEDFGILSSLKKGDQLYLGKVELKQHYTQPPPRYSEGSLVKKLEELGIGRPSTYASTLKVLQDRNYVTVKSRVLYPEFRGRMVSAFLLHHFSEVTDYSFTADMETELDNVSAGLTEWKGLLRDYWTRFSSYCSRVESVHIHQVEKMLEKTFGDFLFASLPNKSRTCPSCMEGTLIFKVSRFGAGYFIGCNQHPKCKYIAKKLCGDEEEEESPQKSGSVEEPKLLGLHPGSNEKVLLKNGPYGYYVQLGEDRMGYLPKRSSVPHRKKVDSITLDDALELLRYPLTLGEHPKDGHPVILKLAKVGFSVRHRRTNASVPKSMKPKDITLEKALEFLSSKDVRRSGRPTNKPKVEEVIETR